MDRNLIKSTLFFFGLLALIAVANGCATVNPNNSIFHNPTSVEVDCVGYMPRDCALKQVDATLEGVQRDSEWVACSQAVTESSGRMISSMEARNMAVTVKCGETTRKAEVDKAVTTTTTTTLTSGKIYGSTVRYGHSPPLDLCPTDRRADHLQAVNRTSIISMGRIG